MKSQAKERIYLLIMVFCLLICAVLLISVFLGQPILVSTTQIHRPVLPVSMGESRLVQSGGEVVLSEEYLEEQLMTVLPHAFLLDDLSISIQKDGVIDVEVEAQKDQFKNFLADLGVELSLSQHLFFGLLPRTLEMELVLVCTFEEGQLLVRPYSVGLNDEEITLDDFPAPLLAVLDEAVNTILQASGSGYDNVQFSDGAIILR